MNAPSERRALGAIHAELAAVRRRRVVVFVAYLFLTAAVLAALSTVPAEAKGGAPRDGTWTAALLLLFAGSGAATAVALGVLLVRRAAAYAIGGAAFAALVAGLALAVDPTFGVVVPAARCFAFGTGVAAAVMLGLGVVSGRVWRRFPDPSLFLAIGVTGVAVAFLHLRCPSTDALHLFGSHLTPIVVLYFAGRFASRARERILREA